jgi:general stress protein CsbA
MLDTIKLIFSVVLVVAGIWGYYLLDDWPIVLRVLSVAGGLVAGFVAKVIE